MALWYSCASCNPPHSANLRPWRTKWNHRMRSRRIASISIEFCSAALQFRFTIDSLRNASHPVRHNEPKWNSNLSKFDGPFPPLRLLHGPAFRDLNSHPPEAISLRTSAREQWLVVPLSCRDEKHDGYDTATAHIPRELPPRYGPAKWLGSAAVSATNAVQRRELTKSQSLNVRMICKSSVRRFAARRDRARGEPIQLPTE
jgi:hypothetical protein